MGSLTVLVIATVALFPRGAQPVRDAHTPRVVLAAPSLQAATVQGTVTVKPEPPRRVANRYAGASAPTVRQAIPVVVYLRAIGTGAARPAARTFEMAQRDTAFAPAFLIVTNGSSVTFRNQDPFYHNVFSYSKAKRFDLGRFPRPEGKAVVFDKSGPVELFCEIHRSMRAVVLVTDTRHHAEVGPNGRYSLPDVAPGRYDLIVWHAEKGEKVVPITVPASGVLTVDAVL